MTRQGLGLIAVVPGLLLSVTVVMSPRPALGQFTAVTTLGDLNTATTWQDGGGLNDVPIAGDTNTWTIPAGIEVRVGDMAGQNNVTWEGQELIVQGELEPGIGLGPNLTMNGDLTLDDGGLIFNRTNGPFNIDLTNNTFTLNGGQLRSGGSNNPARDLEFSNAVLAGSGTVEIRGLTVAGPDRSDVIFTSTVDTTGFTGIFTSSFRARFDLPEVTPENASFGIDISGTAGLILNDSLAVTSAAFDGASLAAGTYTLADLQTMFPGRLASGSSETATLTVVGSGEGTPGDFDGDGLVTAADYSVWRDSVGAVESVLSAGSGDGSGTVDAGDYGLWTAGFAPAAAVAPAAAPVPEPTALALLLAACVTVATRRRSA